MHSVYQYAYTENLRLQVKYHSVFDNEFVSTVKTISMSLRDVKNTGFFVVLKRSFCVVCLFLVAITVYIQRTC